MLVIVRCQVFFSETGVRADSSAGKLNVAKPSSVWRTDYQFLFQRRAEVSASYTWSALRAVPTIAMFSSFW